MIGYHATPEYLIDSDGNVCKEPPFLDWLLENKDTKVCYDLDAFAACMFKLIKMTQKEASTLIGGGKLRTYPYQFTYFPGRYLAFSKVGGADRPFVSFSDMSRYLVVSHNPDEDALSKAREARNKALEIREALKEIANGVDAEAVGSITKAIEPVLKNLTTPTHLDVPAEVVQLALDSVKGNWVEAFQIGYCDHTTDLDISSAYGSILANLPDIRRGRWVESPEPPDEAVLGFGQGIVTRKANLSPVIYRKNDSLFPAVGSYPDVIDLTTLKYIRKWGEDSFQPETGWWWIPEGEQKYPYRGIINWMWQKRQTSSPMANALLKRFMAWFWGQTLADYGTNFGERYNPVYGAIVEASCRVQVCEFIKSHNLEPHLLHVAVDGCLLDCPVELPPGRRLGDWRVSYQGKALIVNSAYCLIEGKAGEQEFAHSFERIMPLITADPGASSYRRDKWAVITLGQAMATEYDKMGTIGKVSDELRLMDTKRLYLKRPENGGELLKGLYPGMPLDIAFIDLIGE